MFACVTSLSFFIVKNLHINLCVIPCAKSRFIKSALLIFLRKKYLHLIYAEVKNIMTVLLRDVYLLMLHHCLFCIVSNSYIKLFTKKYLLLIYIEEIQISMTAVFNDVCPLMLYHQHLCIFSNSYIKLNVIPRTKNHSLETAILIFYERTIYIFFIQKM